MVQAVEAGSLLKLPGLQGLQGAPPVLKVPAGHCTHAAAPAGEELPAPHGRHADGALCPCSSL